MAVHKDHSPPTKRNREPVPILTERPAKRVRLETPLLIAAEVSGCRRSPRLQTLQQGVRPQQPTSSRRSRRQKHPQGHYVQPLATERHTLPPVRVAEPSKLGTYQHPQDSDTGKEVQEIQPALNQRLDYIEQWLHNSHSSESRPNISEADALDTLDAMSHKHHPIPPTPRDSFDASTSVSRRSERSTSSVRDSDYRQSLKYRNVYIEGEAAPVELIRRAQHITSHHRASPEMDDAAIQELKDKSRHLQEDAEEEIVQQLAPGLIPAMKSLPDGNLARNADQLWSDSVPLPLDRSVLISPLPLPKPKPDLAFGYSEAAFTRDQLGTIGLLVDDMFGSSNAVPDQKLRFPFLAIEFKSQAKNGTHYVATNQAAGAGAIALNGIVDLTRRSNGMKDFDYEEPQFFSVTMDHEMARVNVHWIQAPRRDSQHCFHVEGLSQHLLRDRAGVQALVRTIKNILQYGADTRLRTLCKALDTYRESVIRDREAADPQRIRHESMSKRETRSDEKITRSRHQPQHKPAPALDCMEKQTKRNRHSPSPPRSVENDTSNARNAAPATRNKAYYVSSNDNQPPRHAFGSRLEDTKRRIRPTEKAKDSYLASGVAKPKRRHDP